MALEERKRDDRDVASLPGDVVRLIKEHVIESAIDSEPRVGLMLDRETRNRVLGAMDYYDGYEDEFTDEDFEKWKQRPETIEGVARGERVVDLLITQRMQAVRDALEAMECPVCGCPLPWWLSDDDWEQLFAALNPDGVGADCWDNNPTWTAVTPHVQRAVAMISEGAKYVEPHDSEKDMRWRPPLYPVIKDYQHGWDCEECHVGMGNNCPGCMYPVCNTCDFNVRPIWAY